MITSTTFRGGSTVYQGNSIDEKLRRRGQRFIFMNPTAGGALLRLPSLVRDMRPGGPYYWLQNRNIANDVTVMDSLGVTLGTVLARHTILVFLLATDTVEGTWRLAGGGNTALFDNPSEGQGEWNYGSALAPNGTAQNYGDYQSGTGQDVDFGSALFIEDPGVEPL